MPRERFFHLSEEKKAGIIRAAEEEFSRNRYENISISRIVRKAGISQGSFYTYFDGKEDLRRYLISNIWGGLEHWVYKILEMCNGNICDVALYSVVKLLKLDRETQEFCVVKNTILDTGLARNVDFTACSQGGNSTENFRNFAANCYKRTDLATVRVMDIDGYAGLLELLIMIVLKSAAAYVVGDMENTKILINAERQIQLLRA